MFFFNRRARRHLINMICNRSHGKCIEIKPFVKTFFLNHGYTFDDKAHKTILFNKAIFREGSIPYVKLNIGNSSLYFCVDTGSSHNLMTPESYSKIKHLEKFSYKPPKNISLRNITNQISLNIIRRISLIPFFINDKEYVLKFFISTSFSRNFLGSDFMIQAQASLIFSEENNFQTLLINKKHLQIEHLFLNELNAQNSLIKMPFTNSHTYKADPNKILEDHVLFGEQAFKIYGSKEKIQNKAIQILQEYGVFDTNIDANSSNLDYENLDENEVFPAQEIDNFKKKGFICHRKKYKLWIHMILKRNI